MATDIQQVEAHYPRPVFSFCMQAAAAGVALGALGGYFVPLTALPPSAVGAFMGIAGNMVFSQRGDRDMTAMDVVVNAAKGAIIFSGAAFMGVPQNYGTIVIQSALAAGTQAVSYEE